MLQTRSMTLSMVAVGVLAITGQTASGHVAPSVDDNNRYLKVTPMRGGFRLAYTVFFGEVPGAAERKLLDANRDGRIDESEAKRFGDKLAAEVAASLTLEVDGKAQRITWSIVDVGLGTPSVTGGSFSVDMVTYACAGAGRIRLRDGFRIPRPGETEVLVEDSPGVTVKTARVGAADDPTHDYKFLGAGGPLTEEGLTVEWTADATAPALPPGPGGGACGAMTSTGSARLPIVVGAGVLLAGAAAGGVVLARRQRRRRAAAV